MQRQCRLDRDDASLQEPINSRISRKRHWIASKIRALKPERGARRITRSFGCALSGMKQEAAVVRASCWHEIGDAKMRAARSNFAANFFACAGFEIVTQRFSSAGEIAACGSRFDRLLCSSDPEYPDLVAELMPRLKARDRTMPVLIAGYPDSAEQPARQSGVADFVHIRSNPIELLTEWQHRLGIKD